jgi:hypothetical protein
VSFRRYVGKVVRVTARGADGAPATYLAKLFEYEESGIWLHHTDEVKLPGGETRKFDGYLFIPHTHLVNVFGCDELDKAVDELLAPSGGGA